MTQEGSEDFRLAIIGSGFAGLTAAAGLLKKRARCSITIFEQYDAVVPMQQGSDSRWVHPHIYTWPDKGSESFSAALPVLNWTASRASDVVVKILHEWNRLFCDGDNVSELKNRVSIYCNARHVHVAMNETGKVQIEWVGESREPDNPSILKGQPNFQVGKSEAFDAVILAVGFGIENRRTTSYWRNETLAQPSLFQSSNRYIVSGIGDSALIDLFRLRISNFRQDRILSELFESSDLLAHLRSIRECPPGTSLFDAFNSIATDHDLAIEFEEVISKLVDRLRRDTTAVLRHQSHSLAEVFQGGKASFQNQLLLFLLFKAGGFQPSSESIGRLRRQQVVSRKRVIRRYGTKEEENLKDILSDEILRAIRSERELGFLQQEDKIKWKGGYFDTPLSSSEDDAAGEEVKARWRKEYLPGPTQVLASSFCSAIAGFLEVQQTRETSRLRVTLHRKLLIGDEILLQQCCDYAGSNLRGSDAANSAGRTFTSTHATIGAAFSAKEIVRTLPDAELDDIVADMNTLELTEESRNMATEVRSIIAIPLIRSAGSAGDGDVTGVLYIDSTEENLFIKDETVRALKAMASEFLKYLSKEEISAAGNVIRNEYWTPDSRSKGTSRWRKPNNLRAMQFLDEDPPIHRSAPLINFDYSDFRPIESQE